MMYFGNKMMDFGGRFIGLGVMILVCLAVLTLIVVSIIALIRYIRVTGHGHKVAMPPAGMPGINPALQILDERYARGELTDEEYRVKKAEIVKQ